MKLKHWQRRLEIPTVLLSNYSKDELRSEVSPAPKDTVGTVSVICAFTNRLTANPDIVCARHLRKRVAVVVSMLVGVVSSAVGCAATRLGELRHAVRDRRRPPRELVRVRPAAVPARLRCHFQVPADAVSTAC
jgi:hypothetical protein